MMNEYESINLNELKLGLQYYVCFLFNGKVIIYARASLYVNVCTVSLGSWLKYRF